MRILILSLFWRPSAVLFWRFQLANRLRGKYRVASLNCVYSMYGSNPKRIASFIDNGIGDSKYQAV